MVLTNSLIKLDHFIADEINSQLNEQVDVDRNIRNMQNDMLKLNQLLTKEGKLKEGLQQDNILMENDFVSGLKVCMERNNSSTFGVMYKNISRYLTKRVNTITSGKQVA